MERNGQRRGHWRQWGGIFDRSAGPHCALRPLHRDMTASHDDPSSIVRRGASELLLLRTSYHAAYLRQRQDLFLLFPRATCSPITFFVFVFVLSVVLGVIITVVRCHCEEDCRGTFEADRILPAGPCLE